MQTFLDNARLEEAIAQGNRAAGTADIDGIAADMKGYEGVAARVEFGTIAATAVTAVKMQEASIATGADADWADVEDLEVAVPDGHDNNYVTLDMPNIRKRYARVVVERGTANAAIRSAQYIKYRPAFAPTTQPADDLTKIMAPA